MFKPSCNFGFTDANILNPSFAKLYVALFIQVKNSKRRVSTYISEYFLRYKDGHGQDLL